MYARSSLLVVVLVTASLTGSSRASVTDLSGGVFITHYAPSIEQTGNEPDEGWGDFYLASADAISSSGQQNTQIPDAEVWSIWFILAAWDEYKEFCSFEIGLGDYTAEDYGFLSNGSCTPGNGADLELPTSGWPGPNEGTSVNSTGGAWTGNFVPIYFFTGYAYYGGTIPLAPSPEPRNAASFTTCEGVPVDFEAVCLGAMGLLSEPGTACGPIPETAACCIGSVCAVLADSDCSVLGGVWLAEVTTCEPDPCTPVACCIDDTCQLLSPSDCDDLGGDWPLDVHSCDTDPCVEAACCSDSTCLVLYEADCLHLGGNWLDGLSNCVPNPCPLSTCCVDDICEIMPEFSCALLGGVWRAGYDICTPNPCAPDLFVLRPDGSGDYPTIQAAITASAAKDTIELEDGIYSGNGNRDVDCLGRAIVVRSQSRDARLCVIDCEGLARGFIFQTGEGEGTALEGVTIRNGASESGAGICFYDSSPLVSDCILSSNHATLGGGGMYCNFASPTITGCTYSENSALLGGAVFVLDSPSASLQGCTLARNSASNGGGLFCNASALWMENCIVAFGTEGEATYSAVGGTITLSCCDIFGNAGGDWTGEIADQLGIDGNFSLDPYFCEPDSADYHLWNFSPCLQWDCGQIGAWPQGCESFAEVSADHPDLPISLVLFPNSPNPFRGSTLIRYGVPTSTNTAPVRLTIHDCAGRLVRILNESIAAPGVHRISWDGTNQLGSPVPAGVYFYELRHNGQAETSRMLVVR
ncbi:right-handed parallel beta-helix repeat-containing protein [Candidatus Eisenbacteria bacterium]|uniref:Right-handed parallel beta-helix repeat-containing protein n=1 Tax=Eiseniibacteriota bacterium TaxID=2212470 RepID=A0ABV6YJB9_UNCEI